MWEEPTTEPAAAPGDLVANEFAEISVRVDHHANGPRLRLEDLRTGRVRYVDPLELETIVWLPECQLQELLDPSAHRWSGRSEEEDMRVIVNPSKCQGIGMCEERVPELFEIQSGGYAVVLTDEVPLHLENEVRAAVARCPTESISVAG